jgi:hypothetical protein
VCAAPINDPEAKVRYADISVIHATTGEFIRTVTIDPTRQYHGTGRPPGFPDPAEWWQSVTTEG